MVFAETLVRVGQTLIKDYPPEGRAHWAAKAWDREPFENAPKVGADLALKRKRVGDLLEEYGKDRKRVLEFCCGTGKFTEIAVARVDAPEFVAVDISKDGLALTRKNVPDPRLKTVQGDFWKDLGVGTADLVMCINAIHHLGDIGTVIERLLTFVEPGGVLVGNVLTMDNFHEFQRDVHGARAHLARSALFLANSVAMRASGGRVRWASYRSQLLPADEVELILRRVAPNVVHVDRTRYILNFVVQC